MGLRPGQRPPYGWLDPQDQSKLEEPLGGDYRVLGKLGQSDTAKMPP